MKNCDMNDHRRKYLIDFPRKFSVKVEYTQKCSKYNWVRWINFPKVNLCVCVCVFLKNPDMHMFRAHGILYYILETI